jgi:hypothetical protein
MRQQCGLTRQIKREMERVGIARARGERERESLLLLAAHYCLVVTLKNYQSRLSPTWETKHVAATANLQAAKLQTTQEGLHALCSLMFIERTAAAVLRLRFDTTHALLRCARGEIMMNVTRAPNNAVQIIAFDNEKFLCCRLVNMSCYAAVD